MLRIEPVTPAWADALAAGDHVFAVQFGVPVVAGWAGFPDVVPRLPAEARYTSAAEWGSHLVFDEDRALIGLAGWKGEPVDGVAELGYAIAPARQGQGHATAVVRELIARAQRKGLRRALAHTLATDSPSTSVLNRCGFTKTGDVLDAEVGAVWRWERKLSVDRWGGAALGPSATRGSGSRERPDRRDE